MSMLSDQEIIDALQAFRPDGLVISPYDPTRLQPASYDLTLSPELKLWVPSYGWVDHSLDDSPYQIEAGTFLIASTVERVKIPRDLVGRLEGKSTLGRKGLIVHATAGFIDPGFAGHLTLEMHALAMPVSLTPGMPICQIAFHRLGAPAMTLYRGKYQGQSGPTLARE